jgi:hypothetical protein
MKQMVLAVLVMFSGMSYATDIDAISGKYTYEKYKTTLRNGASLSLQNLGAKSAAIEISRSMKATLTMNMLDGRDVIAEAKIIEVKVSGSRGYFVAHWPDMNAPVREEFKLTDDGLTYFINFTNPSDPMQYGAREEAELRRVGR